MVSRHGALIIGGFVAFPLALAALVEGGEGSDRVSTVRVIDGDGLELDGESYRLWGVDAPELDQRCRRDGASYACGERARAALVRLVEGRVPECETLYEGPWGRSIARCSIDDGDLGGAMVRAGWALDFERYSDGAYADDEEAARVAERGLWAGQFIQPWDWRRAN